jgi:regulator of sigma E protease
VGGVLADSPALTAGLQAGDKITAIEDITVSSSEEIQNILKDKTNTSVKFTILRGEESLDFPITTDDAGKIGISFALKLKIDQYPFYTAPYYALQETGRLSLETVKFAGAFFGKILTRGELEDGVGGPVKIAEMTYTLVSFGDLMKLLQFVVLLSLSLAVVNLMPLPALDGGRFFFLLIEAITGRPVNQNFEILLHRLGFFALLALIVAITYRDIISLF